MTVAACAMGCGLLDILGPWLVSGRRRLLMTQLGYPCSVDDAAARLGYWLADPMSRVLVAERDRAVIGCLSLHAVP